MAMVERCPLCGRFAPISREQARKSGVRCVYFEPHYYSEDCDVRCNNSGRFIREEVVHVKAS